MALGNCHVFFTMFKIMFYDITINDKRKDAKKYDKSRASSFRWHLFANCNRL